MGVLDFAKTETTSTNTARRDRPAAKLWLNVGYDANGRFVNLPMGLPLDTMEATPVKGQNEEWKQFATARNKLMEELIAAGEGLEPGQEVEVNLTIKLRKANEETAVADDESNPFIARLNLVG